MNTASTNGRCSVCKEIYNNLDIKTTRYLNIKWVFVFVTYILLILTTVLSIFMLSLTKYSEHDHNFCFKLLNYTNYSQKIRELQDNCSDITKFWKYVSITPYVFMLFFSLFTLVSLKKIHQPKYTTKTKISLKTSTDFVELNCVCA